MASLPAEPLRMPEMMHGFAIRRFGDPGELHQRPVPLPLPSQVLIRVYAAGVNPVDWKIRDGRTGIEKPQFPLYLGNDFAGIVLNPGEDVENWTPGQEVFGSAWLGGAFAEYMVVEESGLLMEKPERVSFAAAAAAPTPALTAMAAHEALQPREGERVLVMGATGGVGTYAVQLLAQAGAKVWATARGAEAQARLRELGAAEIVDYTQPGWEKQLRARQPAGFDAVLDLVHDPSKIADGAQWVKTGGKLASTLYAAEAAMAQGRELEARNANMLRTRDALEDLAERMETGRLKPPPLQGMPLEKAGEALEKLKQGQAGGKIVLRI